MLTTASGFMDIVQNTENENVGRVSYMLEYCVYGNCDTYNKAKKLEDK